MTTIDTILEHFRNGRVTRRESVAALARLITPDNVADVLAALPEDVVADVERWACTVPTEGGVVIGANLSGDEARRIAGSSTTVATARKASGVHRKTPAGLHRRVT